VTLRIEIQEQPERNRFFSEVEIGGLTARRDLVTSPRTGDLLADLEEHWAAIRAALRIMRPDLAPARGQEKHEEEEAEAVVGSPAERPGLASMPPTPGPPVEPIAEPDEGHRAELDALRAEAEAAGVRVDRRWGEARLQQEIASARPAGGEGA